MWRPPRCTFFFDAFLEGLKLGVKNHDLSIALWWLVDFFCNLYTISILHIVSYSISISTVSVILPQLVAAIGRQDLEQNPPEAEAKETPLDPAEKKRLVGALSFLSGGHPIIPLVDFGNKNKAGIINPDWGVKKNDYGIWSTIQCWVSWNGGYPIKYVFFLDNIMIRIYIYTSMWFLGTVVIPWYHWNTLTTV